MYCIREGIPLKTYVWPEIYAFSLFHGGAKSVPDPESKFYVPGILFFFSLAQKLVYLLTTAVSRQLLLLRFLWPTFCSRQHTGVHSIICACTLVCKRNTQTKSSLSLPQIFPGITTYIRTMYNKGGTKKYQIYTLSFHNYRAPTATLMTIVQRMPQRRHERKKKFDWN